MSIGRRTRGSGGSWWEGGVPGCEHALPQVVTSKRLLHVQFVLADGTHLNTSHYVVFMYLLQKYSLIMGIMLFMATLGSWAVGELLARAAVGAGLGC